MKPLSKEKIKKKMEKELKRISMMEEVFDELGAKDAASGPISLAKEYYAHESVERLTWLCKYHTFDTDMDQHMANRRAMLDRIRYDALRGAGFTKKETMALCTGYYG